MVLHFPPAPHDIASCRIVDPVAGTAREIHGLEDVNPLSLHLPVPDEKAGRSERGETGADEISRLLLHSLRLLRAGKGLVVPLRIVDPLQILRVLSPLRIPEVRLVRTPLQTSKRPFPAVQRRCRGGAKSDERSAGSEPFLSHTILPFPHANRKAKLSHHKP